MLRLYNRDPSHMEVGLNISPVAMLQVAGSNKKGAQCMGL
jgi:hypothetical protein